MTNARRDRGSGTVLVLGLAGVLIGLCGLVTAVGAATVARHRAESAADLAALAAAAGPGDGADGAPGAGCASARVVAAAGGASVVGCRSLADGSVVVEVTVPVLLPHRSMPGTAPWSARARARAGLVDASGIRRFGDDRG